MRGRQGFPLPIRKAAAFLAWIGQVAELGWALHAALFPRLLLTLWPPLANFWGRDKRDPPTPQLPFLGKANNSEPTIPHTLQPQVHPQVCFSLNEQETAGCLELANPTTAGVFRRVSQPRELFQNNHKRLA